MKAARRLVDPIHFFDRRGNSIVSTDELHAQIKKLREENERLRSLLRAQVNKNSRIIEAQQESGGSPVLH